MQMTLSSPLGWDSHLVSTCDYFQSNVFSGFRILIPERVFLEWFKATLKMLQRVCERGQMQYAYCRR